MTRLYWIILLLMISAAVRGQRDSMMINLKNVVVTGNTGTKSYNFGRWGIRMNYNGKWERDHVESELYRCIFSHTLSKTISYADFDWTDFRFEN